MEDMPKMAEKDVPCRPGDVTVVAGRGSGAVTARAVVPLTRGPHGNGSPSVLARLGRRRI